MIRKNKKFVDPRYFMDEKMELNEALDPLTGFPTTSPQRGTGADASGIPADWSPSKVDYQLEEDLLEAGAEWITDVIDLEDALTKLASNSNSSQQYIQKIKEYLNSDNVEAAIQWGGLGDEVLGAI